MKNTSVLRLFFAAATIVLSVKCYAGQDGQNEEIYTFGIVPQQSASRLAIKWGPLLEYIQSVTGVKLSFKTAPNIPEFEQRLASGDYDISYMNPYHFTVFNNSPGYLAFAKVGNKRIKGIFVSRKDSSIKDLQELSGKVLAFPAPAAFAASVLPGAELNRRGIKFEPKYVNSHDSVYRGVALGLFPAGGGIVRTFNLVEPEVREKLEIIWTSPGYTPHAFAAHPRVPAEVKKQIAEAMIEMSESEKGRRLLAVLGMKELEPAIGSDWDDVRQLNLERIPGTK